MKLCLRRATLREREAILGVRAACIRRLAPDHYTQRQVEGWLAEDNHIGTVDRLERGQVWAGIHEDKVVGYSCGTPGEVEGLFVHPICQGLGFGRQLLAKAEEASHAWRTASIKVVSTHNAQRFYYAQGYDYRRPVIFRFPSGLGIEAHELEKKLR